MRDLEKILKINGFIQVSCDEHATRYENVITGNIAYLFIFRSPYVLKMTFNDTYCYYSSVPSDIKLLRRYLKSLMIFKKIK